MTYPKEISLNRNLKLQNLIKKNGLKTFNPKGEWTGYGYKKLPLAVKINSLKEMRLFNKIKNELEKKPQIKPKKKSEKKLLWIKRLSKLTGISLSDSKLIAKEKENYLDDQIDFLIDKQDNYASIQRDKLIKNLENSNPLRTIKNQEHAFAILSASKRHNFTNYENLLKEGREKAKLGLIERNEVQEYARKKMKKI